MAWFWSDERVKKWFDVEGIANLNNALSADKGVMVVENPLYVTGTGRPSNGLVSSDDGDVSPAQQPAYGVGTDSRSSALE